MSGQERRWYPVQTQPLRERFAAQHLQNQGFGVFLPHRLVSVRHARRLQQRQASYFPGYLFVSLDLQADRWRSVNGTFGVKSLVMFGGRPAAAPSGFVEFLRECVDEQGCISLPNRFERGDRVKMVSGPFADVIGQIDRLESLDRVRVLIDLVSGKAPVVTHPRNLALAS